MRLVRKATAWLLLPFAAWAVWLGTAGAYLLMTALVFAPAVLHARWRWRPTALLLILPLLLVTASLHAVVRYATGTAKMEEYGLRMRDAPNVDAQTGLKIQGIGCTVDNLSDVSNATLRWLTHHYGRMGGAYPPYPSAKQAQALLSLRGEQVPVDLALKGIFFLSHQALVLPKELAEELSHATPRASAAWGLLDGRLLVLHLEASLLAFGEPTYGDSSKTYVIDLDGQFIVDRYVTGIPWEMPGKPAPDGDDFFLESQ